LTGRASTREPHTTHAANATTWTLTAAQEQTLFKALVFAKVFDRGRIEEDVTALEVGRRGLSVI
jgi:hypothetical protein